MPYVACQLQDDAHCLSLTGTGGTLDLNSNTLRCDEGLSLDAITLEPTGLFDVRGGSVALDDLLIDDVDFTLAAGVLGVALDCDVADSTCVYVTAEMNATDASNTDSGGNTGWDFGTSPPATNRRRRLLLACGA